MDDIGQKSKQVTGQEKNRVEFISATVHELKTSLTPIIASAELLLTNSSSMIKA